MPYPAPTPEEADAISAMTDPVIRNLKITQGYHALTLALTRAFGTRDVTWCAYATYASKTAGDFIRGEEIPALVRKYLAKADHLDDSVAELNAKVATVHSTAKVGHSFITSSIEKAMDDVTRNVGQGNLIVFQELAPLFAKMNQLFDGTPPDASKKAALVGPLRPGKIEDGGQDLLIEAFTHYFDAANAADPKVKAELLFAGNALVGYHEQIRLQGPIAGALNSPLNDVLFSTAQSSLKQQVPAAKHGLLDDVLGRVLRPIVDLVDREFDEVSTRWIMTLTLPTIVLDLGKDVPPLPDGSEFPPDLQTLTLPPLTELMAKLDRTPNTLRGSAARDWTDLGDRMNYVVDFFRSRQEDATLYQPPFTEEQVAVIQTDNVPPGPL